MPIQIDNIAGIPNAEVNFDREGNALDGNANRFTAAIAMVAEQKPTDLLIFSHGWRNDEDDARDIYQKFFTNFAQAVAKTKSDKLTGRKFAILGIFWPSMQFSERVKAAEISSAAGLVTPVTDEELRDHLDLLKTALNTEAEKRDLDLAKDSVNKLEDDPQAVDQFVEKVRTLLLPEQGSATDHTDDASDKFFALPPDTLLDTLSPPFLTTGGVPDLNGDGQATSFSPVEFDENSTQNAGASLGDMFGGIKAGAMRFLNYTTYYVMKERSGVVGRVGLSSLIREVQKHSPGIKVHLLGHSFGGRLVTAAALALVDSPAAHVSSMSLLQAAYSHNGLGEKFDGERDGFFRKLVKPGAVVDGPIIVTHSNRDSAVGVAYPIASRLSGNDASGQNPAPDRFGGMGSSGALYTDASFIDLLIADSESVYAFENGHIYNLDGDAIITGHGDITNPSVVRAVVEAVSAT